MRQEHYQVVRFGSAIGVAPPKRPTDARHDLPLGAHLITPRRAYLHHGIYVGGESVVHYSGSTRGLHRGPVEETSLDRFTCGREVWIRSRTGYDFDPYEVVRRARSRLGEDHYRVFTNNCEHFCEWCLHGEHRSYQVEALLSLPGRALNVAMRLVARFVSSPLTTKFPTAPAANGTGIRARAF